MLSFPKEALVSPSLVLKKQVRLDLLPLLHSHIHFDSLTLAVHYSNDGDIKISELRSRQSPPLSRADAINFPLSKLHSIRETGTQKKFVRAKNILYLVILLKCVYYKMSMSYHFCNLY